MESGPGVIRPLVQGQGARHLGEPVGAADVVTARIAANSDYSQGHGGEVMGECPTYVAHESGAAPRLDENDAQR